MAQLPSGVVTLLFSDIEGSTRLLMRMAERYVDALDLHRSVLRDAWVTHGGIEMGTEGDSFFVVFRTAREGVGAAIAAQRSLAAQSWPEGEAVSVRIGVHTGSPMIHDGGYVGVDVHRAARVSASAHGGQIVVTDATCEQARAFLPPGANAVDLGWHRLRDFASPIRLHQVSCPGLRDEFPPLRTMGTATSLPVESTPLVGRESELRSLTSVLSMGAARLVTLTGPPGAGKTRLATALAAAQAHGFVDGVFFVPLSTAEDKAEVYSALAATFGVEGEGPSAQAVADHLADRHALLVLDNLEQIAGGGTAVAEVLAAAPRVTVVATSRRALHILGEHEVAVDPLALPTAVRLGDVDQSPAVQLFVQRAAMVRKGFVLTEGNAADVAGICRRLDGLPLALELAAAQMKVLSPSTLLSRLESTVGLRSSESGRPSRQQTLRDAIAWSYDLLPGALQKSFRALAVFAGGFSLSGVAAVVDLSEDEALDAVTQLVDASLVSVEDDLAGEPRFSMLQAPTEFAMERLVGAGELDATRERHIEYCLLLVGECDPSQATPLSSPNRERLRVEAENLRAALTWTLAPGSPIPPTADRCRLGLRLAALMAPWWFAQSRDREARDWLITALERDRSRQPTSERGSALRWLAELDEWTAGKETFERVAGALAIGRQLGEKGLECDALLTWGRLALTAGDFRTAAERLDQGEAIARSLDDPRRLGSAFWSRSWLQLEQGQFDNALGSAESARRSFMASGDEVGALLAEDSCVACLAYLDRLEEARLRLHLMVRSALDIDHPLWSQNVLETAAHVCARLHDDERSARLLGAHEAHYQAGGAEPNPEADERWRDQAGLNEVRARLGDEAWQSALRAGAALSTTEALAEVLDGVE
jgi:predicted ATPase/class 3 adenylate cyclase